jgi:hypothetical protein
MQKRDTSMYAVALVDQTGDHDTHSFHLHCAALAELGLFRGIGERERFSPDGPDATARFLPGRDLYVNRYVYAEERGGILLGKSRPTSIRSDALKEPSRIPDLFFTGVNSNPIGLRLHLTGRESGTMILTPYHLHALNGDYLRSDARRNPVPNSISGSIARFDGAIQKIRDKDGESGHGLIYLYEGEGALFATSYDINYFEDTASITPDRSTRDRIDYTTLSFGFSGSWGRHYGAFWISADRSAGYYRTSHRNHRGVYEGVIDGYAIRSEIIYREERLNLALYFFLPEPATIGRGSISSLQEKSGYILNGANPAQSPLLADTLDYIPSPIPCPNRDICDGILTSADEAGHRNHAALLRLDASYEIERSTVMFSMEGVRPLAYRTEDGRNPFRRTKTDEGEFSLLETTIGLDHNLPECAILFELSLLQRFNREQRVRFAGRSLGIALSIHL